MPLFKSKPKPVEGLDDVPSEDEASLDSFDEDTFDVDPASKQLEESHRAVRQKVKPTSKKDHNRTVSTRLQEAEMRRTRMKLARQLSSESAQDTDSIETLLGVDPKGFCLRHPMFLIRSGNVVPPNRLETILDCKLCRQDSVLTLPKGYHREHTIDSSGQVKQLAKNKKGWKDKLNEGSYRSDDGDFDGSWKEQASLRLDQVLIWDIDKAPLKCNPQYAKYFRMIKDGTEMETVKQLCEMENMDPRTLDFDPDVPLAQQLDDSMTLTQSAKDEIRYSASGKGPTPEALEEAVNSLHEAYIQHYQPPDPPTKKILSPDIVLSPVKNLRKSFSNSFKRNKENNDSNNNNNSGSTGPKKMATPVMATIPAPAKPVKATPVRRNKRKNGLFGFGGSSEQKPTKSAKSKRPKDEKEELREQQMQELRERQRDEREERELRKEKKQVSKLTEKKKVSKLTGIMLGNGNRTVKLQRALDELEETRDELLNVRLQADEKSSEGSDLIAQIQTLQLKLEATNKYQEALSNRINEVRKERGMPPLPLRRKESSEDVTSTGSFDGFDRLDSRGSERSLGYIPEPIPISDDKMISFSDKLRADNEASGSPKTRRRKSTRSRRRRASQVSKASRKSVKPTREPCFDREFLIEKFQEAIRKLMTINRFFQQANDLAMSKENSVDQKSMGARKSVMADLIIPDFEDEDWEYYDVEIEDEPQTDDESIDDDTFEDSLAPLPPPGTFGSNRNSLQAMPMYSPSINHARKSVVVRRASTRSFDSAPPPPPPPANPNSKVRFNDEKLFTVRVIPRIPTDLFYTTDEIKLFRFEKFMDDNADEFEVVDDEEWEEEEVIEDDDYSYESYDDESYFSEEEVTVTEGWTYDESQLELQKEATSAPPPPPASTNENKASSGTGLSRSDSAENLLADLLGQMDALITRKTSDTELMASMSKEVTTANRGLPDVNAGGDELLTSLADEQIQELRRTFHAFDTNGSGYIEHDELKVGLKTLGYNVTEEFFNNLIVTVGSKDSRLNFAEFIAWNRALWRDEMKEIFKAIDTKTTGYIDKDELKAYFDGMGQGFTDEELDELVYEMDPQGDDRIQLDDFINVMAAAQTGNSYCVVNGELYIEKLKADFRYMDVDNTGYISRENLQEMAGQSNCILSEKELDGTMKTLDLDGNGRISIDEFIAASVRITVPSVEKESRRRSSMSKEMLLSTSPHSKDSVHRMLDSSMSLLSTGKGGLETVEENPQEHPETEAEKYHKRLAALENKSQDTDINTGTPPRTKTKDKNLSLSRSTHTEGSRSSLSFIDQKRTYEMNKSHEVSMSELSALTVDVGGQSRAADDDIAVNQRLPPTVLARVSSVTVDPALRTTSETESTLDGSSNKTEDNRARDILDFEDEPALAPAPAPGKADTKASRFSLFSGAVAGVAIGAAKNVGVVGGVAAKGVTGAAKGVAKGVGVVGGVAAKGVTAGVTGAVAVGGAAAKGAAKGVGVVGEATVKGVTAVGTGAVAVGGAAAKGAAKGVGVVGEATVKGVTAGVTGAVAVGGAAAKGAAKGVGVVGEATVKGVTAVGSGAVAVGGAAAKGAAKGVGVVGEATVKGVTAVGTGAVAVGGAAAKGAAKGVGVVGEATVKGVTAVGTGAVAVGGAAAKGAAKGVGVVGGATVKGVTAVGTGAVAVGGAAAKGVGAVGGGVAKGVTGAAIGVAGALTGAVSYVMPKSNKGESAPAPAPNADAMKAFEPAPAPAPKPAPVPNAFKKKPQFLKSNSSSRLNKTKPPPVDRDSTMDSKNSKYSEVSTTTTDEEGGGANLPIISIGDKLEADKQALADGSQHKKKRRKRKSTKSKLGREENLDPQWLRDTFKQRIRKLIALNRFFQQANDALFDKELGNDRKSMVASNDGVSLLNKMSVSDIEELEDLYFDDSDTSDSEFDDDEEQADVVGGLGGFRASLRVAPERGLHGMQREFSRMSVTSTTSFAPPSLATAKPMRSSINTAERKQARAGMNIAFKPEKKMHKVKLIPFLTEEQIKEVFWSQQDLKLFRFEKFMQDNANEFDILEEEEDEYSYEEEEYEEVSWVSGDEYSYEEETLESDSNDHGFSGQASF